MLSETVDSTSNCGKREWYQSSLVNKSEQNGKGCGFKCEKCRTGFWFAKLKPGVVPILMSSHTAAFKKNLLFFSLFRLLNFGKLLISQNALTQIYWLKCRRQHGLGSRPGFCTEEDTHFWPIQQLHQVGYLYVHMHFHLIPVLDNCPPNGPNYTFLGHQAHRVLHGGVLALVTQEGKVS